MRDEVGFQLHCDPLYLTISSHRPAAWVWDLSRLMTFSPLLTRPHLICTARHVAFDYRIDSPAVLTQILVACMLCQ
jgi:hypothetical protein